MARIIVFPDKNIRKKDSWNWKVEEPSRRKKGKKNVLYTAQGYDTFSIAMRQARSHNRKLKNPLLVEIRSATGRAVGTPTILL